MKHSMKFKLFVYRVGSFFLLVYLAILFTKYFFPGYEAFASAVVCVSVILFSLVQEDIKKSSLGRKRRENKK